MNLEEKLESFSNMAISEAEKKRNEMLKKIKEESSLACDEFRKKENRRKDEILKEENAKIQQEKNKKLIETSIKSKKTLIDLREKLTNDLFSSVTKKIEAYITSDEYLNKLKNDITKLSDEYNDEIEIYLDKRNMSLKSQLNENKNINIKILEAKENLLGGYKALIKSKNIIIDNSYREKIMEEQRNFSKIKI